MEIATSYFSGSGSFWAGCCFLAQRYDQETGFKPGEAESWVFSLHDDPTTQKSRFINRMSSDSWLTGLWRSPAGVVYVSDADLGEVHSSLIAPDTTPASWKRTNLESPLYGVWGLDDRCVFAWGSTHLDKYPVFRFDGRAWNRISDPGFQIIDMHGCSADLIYAVGTKGQVARFDGRGWQMFSTPTAEPLVSVFVVSGDEIYACGREGSLLEGSATGWGKIAEGPGLPHPLRAVAKWNGDLWVGAGPFGLLRRVGRTDQLEALKPNIHAIHFDARQELLITCPEIVAATRDGKAFKGAGTDVLKDFRQGKKLLDLS